MSQPDLSDLDRRERHQLFADALCDLGMTQREFADLVGRHPSFVTRMKREDTIPLWVWQILSLMIEVEDLKTQALIQELQKEPIPCDTNTSAAVSSGPT